MMRSASTDHWTQEGLFGGAESGLCGTVQCSTGA